MFIKWSSLHKSVSKFTPKKLMRSTPRACFRYSTLGQAPALPANIRLGWKGLPWANASTYYKKLRAVKSFTTLGPDRKLFQKSGDLFLKLTLMDSFIEWAEKYLGGVKMAISPSSDRTPW
jgi:hypothetical protein